MIQDTLLLVLFAIALLGCLSMLVTAMLVPWFARREQPARGSEPAVSVLLPLHGDEVGLFANLASFCDQVYSGPIQIILGVRDRHDPAIHVVERLQRSFPDRQLDLVVDAAGVGSNPKVANLVAMSSRIQHEIVLEIGRAHVELQS